MLTSGQLIRILDPDKKIHWAFVEFGKEAYPRILLHNEVVMFLCYPTNADKEKHMWISDEWLKVLHPIYRIGFIHQESVVGRR